MSALAPAAGNYVVLSGGSGGVKLAVGMAQLLGERLAIVVNTGDDFIHLGLHVSPDVDTVLYSLAGVVNDETGWDGAGRRGPSCARWASSADQPGSGWATATSPPMSTARSAFAQARR